MKLLLDEHLSWRVAEVLRAKGFDVVSVHEVGLEGEDDPVVWQRAIAEGRVVVTYDKGDFVPQYAIYFHEGVEHRGLVVIATATISQHDFGGHVRALEELLLHDPDLTNLMMFLQRA